MFIAKFVKGPMAGQEMELQKLDLTIHVKMRVDLGAPSADDEVSYQKGIYIREANQHRSKTPGSKTPYTYVWDGFQETHEEDEPVEDEIPEVLTHGLQQSWYGAGYDVLWYEHHTVLRNSLSSIAIPNEDVDAVARGLLEVGK